MSKKILMVGGEASGDKHGGLLIKALKEIDPNVEILGMGGPQMRRAGLNGLDSTSIAVVGIIEIINKYGDIKKAFNKLVALIDKEDFDGAVLIDFPEFNLRLAKEIKKRKIPIVYYVSPQVWAWREHRKYKIAKLVTKMLVILPFEEDLYKDVGLDTEFVGNPLVEEATSNYTKAEARELFKIESNSQVVAILPGSRSGEVQRILEPMIAGCKSYNDKSEKKVTYLLPRAHGISKAQLESVFEPSGLDFRIVEGGFYDVLKASDAAVVTSGTATLETAVMEVPMVICYKLNYLTYFIGKLFISLKNIGLPNIIAGRTVFKELIQGDLNANEISSELDNILNDETYRTNMFKDLKEIKNKLSGKEGSAQRAAKSIYQVISG